MSVDLVNNKPLSAIVWSFFRFQVFQMPPQHIVLPTSGLNIRQTNGREAKEMVNILRQANVLAMAERYGDDNHAVLDAKVSTAVYTEPRPEWTPLEVLAALSVYENQTKGYSGYATSDAKVIVDAVRENLIEYMIDDARVNVYHLMHEDED